MLKVSKSGYYKYRQRDSQVSQKESLCIDKVKQYRNLLPETGTVKLWKMLQKDNVKIGRQHLNDLLSRSNMLIKSKKRFCRTSISDGSKIYPNLLKGFIPNRKNQVWISDITYIAKNGGFFYLFLLSDMYTRQIIDYVVSPDLKTKNHISMLKRQLKHQNIKNDLIHHTDHGSQYTSNETVKLLQNNTVKISMTGPAKCLDNAIAERINGILKHEQGLKRVFKSIDSLKAATKSAVSLYNSTRLHQSLNYLTPDEFAVESASKMNNQDLVANQLNASSFEIMS